MTAVPVLVAGGGPAGAAAACVLARGGSAPLLIEREAGPAAKVCGDFVSAEAIGMLGALGVDVGALGAARIGAVRLVRGLRVAEAALPFPALGLSREVLDEALLARAVSLGATVRRGRRVAAIDRTAHGFGVRLDGGERVAARRVVLATGKHELRGHARRFPGKAAMVGFKCYYMLAPDQAAALADAVEVILFAGGYAGLQSVEAGRANLCLIVPRRQLAAVGGAWPDVLRALLAACPHLDRRLRGAIPLRERPLAIASVPYGFRHAPAPDDPPGLFRVGDQAHVIPSLTGDGVAMALHSAMRAAEAVLGGEDGGMYHRALRHDTGAQMRIASGLHALCRVPALQAAAMAACSAAPSLIRLAAARTRVRREASLPPAVP